MICKNCGAEIDEDQLRGDGEFCDACYQPISRVIGKREYTYSKMSIGEFSKATGISIGKLRLLDKSGELKPAGKTKGGHRFYTMKQALDYANEKTVSVPADYDPKTPTLGQIAAVIPPGVRLIINECRNRAMIASAIWQFDGMDDEETCDYIETHMLNEVMRLKASDKNPGALIISIRKSL